MWQHGLLVYLMLYRVPLIISQLLPVEMIIRYIFYSSIFTASISILEQVLIFNFNYILFFDLPRYDYDHASYMGLFYRSFAFSNEPSNLAYFLLLTLPFVYIYYPVKYSVIIMLGILPTFSASAFSLFFVGLMMGLVISVFKTSGLIRVKNLLLLTCVVPSILFFVSTIPVFSKIISKLLLSNQVGSVNARWERVVLSLDKFSESPFVGMGPGYWSSTFGVSPNNIYMLVASQIGIFGLV